MTRLRTTLLCGLAGGALSAAIQLPFIGRYGWNRDELYFPANYGEASALERYGPARGLPLVVSGHLSWQYWRPRRLDERFALVVGYDPGFLSEVCSSWRTLARIDNRWHIDNEERGRLIAACTLRRPLGELWNTYIARDVL